MEEFSTVRLARQSVQWTDWVLDENSRIFGLPRHLYKRGFGMTDRTSPPNRRPNETRKLTWAGKTIFVTIGYGADHITPCEIFYDGGYRSGSDMEALVSDLCIALSVMLQHESVTAASLAKSMSTAVELHTGAETPASILGLLLFELQRPPAWSADLANALRDTENAGLNRADGSGAKP